MDLFLSLSNSQLIATARSIVNSGTCYPAGRKAWSRDKIPLSLQGLG